VVIKDRSNPHGVVAKNIVAIKGVKDYNINRLYREKIVAITFYGAIRLWRYQVEAMNG
jgi:hypothetical protein